jgi:LuxR family transcriptional regulator, maltose regulon positive regulatory protein
METPLITTKLYIPLQRNEIMARPRLEKLLKDRLMRRLTLISAPAGFGKTTLAIRWLTQAKIHIAWYSLDENDNNLVKFFTYFITALQHLNKSFGRSVLEALNTTECADFESIVARMINELMNIEQETALVLDDYHLIQQPEINQAIALLLDHVPPNLHIVILSRIVPSLPISKFRSKSQLTELYASDLRFTLKETEAFLNQTMQLNLEKNETDLLEEKTEGWIVGLQLAALSIPYSSSSKDYIENFSGSDRYVTDYLIDEVISIQSSEMQEFLFKTSFLDRFCADLCEAITGARKSSSILETLDASNLFILPLDNQRKWYRYHHLFADLLQTKFEKEFPQKCFEIYLKAYHWCIEEGLFEEAIQYAIKGKHFFQAADTIKKMGIEVFWRNQKLMARDWLNALPDQLIFSDPQLSILQGYIAIGEGRLRDSELVFDRVFTTINNNATLDNNQNIALKGIIMAGNSIVSFHHHLNWEQTLFQANLALKFIPVEYQYDRCVAYFHCGGSLMQLGETTKAEQNLLQALALTKITNTSGQKLNTLGNLGQLKLMQGQLQQASNYWQEAHKYAKSQLEVTGSTFTHVLTGLGNLHYEWNQLDKANEYLEEAMEIAAKTSEFSDRILISHAAAIRLACGRQQLKKAKQLLSNINQLIIISNPGKLIKRRIELFGINIALAEQDRVTTSNWFDQFSPETQESVTFELEPELVLWIRCSLERKETQKAIPLLLTLIDLAKNQQRFYSLIQLEILLAKAYFIQKEPLQGIEHLKIALIHGGPDGFIRSFLDEGSPINFLLGKLLTASEILTESNISSDYVESLVSAFKTSAPGKFTQQEDPDDFLIQLTVREKEILPYLAKGFSYASIADQLNVSQNTIRFHIKNIYEKFQVNNRTHAIIAAQKYGFIQI